jgi:hypothetical protein
VGVAISDGALSGVRCVSKSPNINAHSFCYPSVNMLDLT